MSSNTTTLSNLPLEVQGVFIFINWILCMSCLVTCVLYVLIWKQIPQIPKCIPLGKREEKSEETEEEYRERVEREIDVGRVQVRQDMKLIGDFKDDLGM
jgi:hypothetical protein